MSALPKKAVIYTDGASSGNPGKSGIGVVIEFGGRTHEISEHIGIATNNIAEYSALIRGLERASELGADSVEAFSDSELLVKQLTGVYRVKHENIIPLWKRARELSAGFRFFSISHLPRDLNKQADRLSKKAVTLSPEKKAVTS